MQRKRTRKRKASASRPKSYDTGTRLSDLQTFLDVAKAKVQADSAVLRGRTQADVSRRCTRVEELFGGGDLFDRTPSGTLELNAVGKEVAEQVQQLFAFIVEMRARRISPQLVRVGFTPVARGVVTEAVRAADGGAAAVPGVIQIREATADVFIDLLAQRELDLAVGFDLGLDTSGFKKRIRDRVLTSQPLELVLPRQRAEQCPRTIKEAVQNLRRCFIRRAVPNVPPQALRSYEPISSWLESCGVQVARESEVACGTAGELFALCATGEFFGLLPPIAAAGGGDGVQFVVADGLTQEIAVRAYYREEFEPMLRPMLAALKKACVKLNDEHRPVRLRDLPRLKKGRA